VLDADDSIESTPTRKLDTVIERATASGADLSVTKYIRRAFAADVAESACGSNAQIREKDTQRAVAWSVLQ
jgi:hypothetical protein